MANTAIINLEKPAGTDHALISVINSNMDKIDAEAGRQRGNFAGTYSTTSGYAVGDYCIYQGNLYRCTTAIGSSGENWTAAHWTQTKAGTELKGLSDHISNNEIKHNFNLSLPSGWTIDNNSCFCMGKTVVLSGRFKYTGGTTATTIAFNDVIPDDYACPYTTVSASFNNATDVAYHTITQGRNINIYRTDSSSVVEIRFTIMYVIN